MIRASIVPTFRIMYNQCTEMTIASKGNVGYCELLTVWLGIRNEMCTTRLTQGLLGQNVPF